MRLAGMSPTRLTTNWKAELSEQDREVAGRDQADAAGPHEAIDLRHHNLGTAR